MLCPGVPAVPPPPISDYHVEQELSEKKKRTIRFGDEGGQDEEEEVEGDGDVETAPSEPTGVQKAMLAMAGQDLDQFMREMEEVHRTREAEKAADLQQRLARLEGGDGDLVPPGVESTAPPPLRPGVPPPGVRPPPGRPPGVAPPGVRLPPGPPPGVPPRGVVRPSLPRPLGVVSAKPQLNKMEVKTDKVIEGAPVMRNLKSDVTRFVPTNLRVKRDDGRKEAPVKRKAEQPSYPHMGIQHNFAAPSRPTLSRTTPVPQTQTKDDAYAAFMKEMQDLL